MLPNTDLDQDEFDHAKKIASVVCNHLGYQVTEDYEQIAAIAYWRVKCRGVSGDELERLAYSAIRSDIIDDYRTSTGRKGSLRAGMNHGMVSLQDENEFGQPRSLSIASTADDPLTILINRETLDKFREMCPKCFRLSLDAILRGDTLKEAGHVAGKSESWAWKHLKKLRERFEKSGG